MAFKFPWENTVEKSLELVDQFILDKDLAEKLKHKLLMKDTVVWVDALVKLFYAFPHIILPVLRPLGAAAMTAFGMYCHANEIVLDAATIAIFDGAFPGWCVSRHLGKADEIARESKES